MITASLCALNGLAALRKLVSMIASAIRSPLTRSVRGEISEVLILR